MRDRLKWLNAPMPFFQYVLTRRCLPPPRGSIWCSMMKKDSFWAAEKSLERIAADCEMINSTVSEIPSDISDGISGSIVKVEFREQ